MSVNSKGEGPIYNSAAGQVRSQQMEALDKLQQELKTWQGRLVEIRQLPKKTPAEQSTYDQKKAECVKKIDELSQQINAVGIKSSSTAAIVSAFPPLTEKEGLKQHIKSTMKGWSNEQLNAEMKRLNAMETNLNSWIGKPIDETQKQSHRDQLAQVKNRQDIVTDLMLDNGDKFIEEMNQSSNVSKKPASAAASAVNYEDALKDAEQFLKEMDKTKAGAISQSAVGVQVRIPGETFERKIERLESLVKEKNQLLNSEDAFAFSDNEKRREEIDGEISLIIRIPTANENGEQHIPTETETKALKTFVEELEKRKEWPIINKNNIAAIEKHYQGRILEHMLVKKEVDDLMSSIKEKPEFSQDAELQKTYKELEGKSEILRVTLAFLSAKLNIAKTQNL